MQCTLLVPHLFWPRDTADAIERDLELPALTRILARARAHRAAPLTSEAWLCQAFEVEPQQDWPVAPLTLALDGGEAGDRYWLRADPVHLKVERNRVLLVEPALFDVTIDEAQAFAGVLNAHFGEEVSLEARAAKRWYVSAPAAPSLVTRAPHEASGQDVRSNLPTGADAPKWHRIFNDAQMLLHEHPLNEARAARGEAVINSVWFWGGGKRPRVPGRHFNAVWSNDALATALGAVADLATHDLPDAARSWFASAESRQGTHLIVLNDLATATRYGDADAWRTRAARLDADWLAPLAGAVRDGRLQRLVLAIPAATRSWRFEMTRSDLFKFWRPAKPLREFA